MRKSVIALCLLTLSTSCAKQTNSEPTKPADDFEWFKQKYLEEEKVLYEQYVVNKKWNVRNLGGFISSGESVCITSRDSSRNVRQFDNVKLIHINAKGEHQFVRTEDGKVTDHENYTSEYDRQPEQSPYYSFRSVIEVPNIYPMTAFSSDLMPTVFGSAFRRSSLGDFGLEDSLRIKNIEETTFESHNAIAVETWSKTTYYFDLENHLAYLGYVESGSNSGGIFE